MLDHLHLTAPEPAQLVQEMAPALLCRAAPHLIPSEGGADAVDVVAERHNEHATVHDRPEAEARHPHGETLAAHGHEPFQLREGAGTMHEQRSSAACGVHPTLILADVPGAHLALDQGPFCQPALAVQLQQGFHVEPCCPQHDAMAIGLRQASESAIAEGSTAHHARQLLLAHAELP